VGVNLRYIGRAMECCSTPALFEILLLEATARVLKNDLKRRLRKKMMALKVTVMGPYRNLVINFMNRIFYHERRITSMLLGTSKGGTGACSLLFFFLSLSLSL
jgi:hypothetical protein